MTILSLDHRTEGEDGGEDSYKLTMLDKVLVSIVWVMGLVNTLLSEYIVSKNPHTLCSIRDGTPSKRQVSKRQVSKRLVSKRPVSKRQAYKMSGLQNVRFQNVRFQNVMFQNVWFQSVRFQNVRLTKCQVYKTSGF
jgi:hypothetical protein